MSQHIASTQWLSTSIAVMSLLVAASSCIRLATNWRRGRSLDVSVDVSHVVMGVAMAGMLAPTWNVVTHLTGEIVFVIFALWFFWCSARARVVTPETSRHVLHYPIHAMMSATMVYMYWIGSGAMISMSRSSTSNAAVRYSGLSALLMVVLFVSAVWNLDALSGRRVNSRVTIHERLSGPGPEVMSHIAMCVAMGYMLVLML